MGIAPPPFDFDLTKILEILTEAPKLIDQFGLMPNINMPTMGGEVFWNDLAKVNGWRVQKNTITGHCRILDNQDYRRAWGSEAAIMEFFKKIYIEHGNS